MSLKSMDVTHLPFCKEVLMLSGVSILEDFSDYRALSVDGRDCGIGITFS